MKKSWIDRQVVGWSLFDLANSSYTTLIVTVSYNVIFANLIVGPRPGEHDYAYGNYLWGLILALSWLVAAIIGPFLGNFSDLKRKRKVALAISAVGCSLLTCGLYFISPGQILIAVVLIFFSNLAYSLSENFISAFLPHITSSENIGKVSGMAWGIGYFGGLATLILCQQATGFIYTLDNYPLLRWIGPITGLFFLVASIPTFLFVKEPPAATAADVENEFSFKKTWNILNDIKRYPDLRIFLVSCFFFQGGISIVISYTSLYGEQVVGISGANQAILFITLQLSAALGAYVFGHLQDKRGFVSILNGTLILWILTILAIFFLKPLASLLGVSNLKAFFIVVCNFAGLCLGATQSSGRALVGLFSPPEKSGEFFGLWGFSVKMAGVFSTLTFAWLQTLVTLPVALLFCILLFVLGLIFGSKVDEFRGKQRKAIV